jgi:hypothetical protein
MTLLDNYLNAVRRNLPPAEADDIVAELRDVLLERAEERERDGAVDWAALLKDYGHPLKVAARYRGDQYLIGPALYPFYRHFLQKIVGIVILAVGAITLFKVASFGGDAGQIIAKLLGAWWSAVLISVGAVTLAFVLIDRFGGMDRHFQSWEPEDLPEVAVDQPTLAQSVFEVSAGLLFILWWTGLVPAPDLASHNGVRILPGPIWAELYVPILILLLARLAYSLVAWLRPGWRAVRGVVDIGTSVGAIALAIIIHRAGRWVTVVATDPAQAARVESSLNISLSIGIAATVIILTVTTLIAMWKLVRPLFNGTGTGDARLLSL